MAFKFNPFTGTFDEVGTGGGGGVPDPLTLNELTVNTLLTADHIHGNLAGSVYIHVKNTDSVQLDAGTPFYITGTVGASDRVEIQAADSSDPAKGPAVGVLETTLAINGEGNGVILGEIFNFDTATPNWSTNDPLYVANGGGLTNVKPTSGYRQIIAYVGRIQASTGTLVLTGTSVDPVAGSNTQIQYNDNGGFGASTDLTWNNTSKELGVGGDLNLDSGGSFSTTIQSVTPTANRTISFPDQTGTVGLVSGATGNIQYNNAGQLAGTGDLNTELDWVSPTGTYTALKVNADSNGGNTGTLLDLQVDGTSKVFFGSNGTSSTNPAIAIGTAYIWSPVTGALAFGTNGSNSSLHVEGQLGAGLRSGGLLWWTNGNNGAYSQRDVAIKRDSAGVVAVTDGSTGTGYLKQTPVPFGTINGITLSAGIRGFISDSNVAAAGNFGAVVNGTNTGTGSNVVPVYYDGTNWRIG
jgi:hypothetical protein